MVWQKKIILKSKIDAWLKISSSLSEIIKQRASYRVNVVNSLKKNLMENELKEFSIFRKEKLFLREVILFANDKPVMYARTVIPRAHLRGFWDELRVLKNKPLGEIIFDNKKISRSSFAYKKLSAFNDLSQRTCSLGIHPEQLVAARQSTFLYKRKSILLTEVFLNNFEKINL
jgi:chorismate--pyruvate lyase